MQDVNEGGGKFILKSYWGGVFGEGKKYVMNNIKKM